MIQIKNRETGLYDRRGHKGSQQWTDKMHKRGCWGSLGHAKTHISQIMTNGCYGINDDAINQYINSDFVIIDEEDFSVKHESVEDYIIERLVKLIKEYEGRDWRKDELKKCKETLKKINKDTDNRE